MAIVTIGQRPDLTYDFAREVFEAHFAGTYKLVDSNALNRHFIVKKDGWLGVGVRLKQDRTGTSFIFTGLIPNVSLQVLFGTFAYFVLRSPWKQMEAEIASFIENEPSFQQRSMPSPQVEKLAA